MLEEAEMNAYNEARVRWNSNASCVHVEVALQKLSKLINYLHVRSKHFGDE